MRLMELLTLEGVAVDIFLVQQQPFLTNALDTLFNRFLASEAERIVVLDDDVTFQPADVLRLVRSPEDAIGGDYPLKAFGSGMVCKAFPGGRENGPLKECRMLGLGFSAWSRKCIEEVAAQSPAFSGDENSGEAGMVLRSMFAQRFEGGRRIDGDVAFFLRVMEAGYTLWCDRSIQLGHVGTHVYTAEDACGSGS